MLNFLFRKLSWKTGLPLALVLLSIWPLCSFFATRPLVDLVVLPISAMGIYPLQKHIPISKIKMQNDFGHDLLRIRLYDKLPHAWDICFLYDDKTKQNLIVRIIWIDPSGLFGQFTCFYEITSPDIREELLNFIAEHEKDLQNQKLQYMLGYMIRQYRTDLTKLGDGDPYVGLERAGVAEWIKEGKDPEAEWKKKFPAETEKEGIRVLSSDVAKDCPDSVTFDNYPGFRDWYRFPVHYPYHFLMIDTLNFGTLEKYDGGDIRDPNRSSVSIDGCTNIIKLGWNSEFLIFERADQRFGLFYFASGQCRIFDTRAERDRGLAHPLPEEKTPSVFFEKFRQ